MLRDVLVAMIAGKNILLLFLSLCEVVFSSLLQFAGVSIFLSLSLSISVFLSLCLLSFYNDEERMSWLGVLSFIFAENDAAKPSLLWLVEASPGICEAFSRVDVDVDVDVWWRLVAI